MTEGGALATWAISAATFAAILLRPGRIGEWIWAAIGACLLIVTQLVPAAQAGRAALGGLEVYLFLIGMIALAELARRGRSFEWLAQALVPYGRVRGARVFLWLYLCGVAVTTLLSNDGTIVLLTPAALALARRAGLPALPLLYACAFVANAASFVLPISNPANLLVFPRLPAIAPWIASFGLPSLAAIACTYAVLRYLFRREISGSYAYEDDPAPRRAASKLALVLVGSSCAIVVVAAALAWPVGVVACALGVLSVLVVALREGPTLRGFVREGPWSIVPLVAALFVVVQGLDRTGVVEAVRTFLRSAGRMPHVSGELLVGAALTGADNVLNNLPAGILTRYATADHGITAHIMHAALVGIDLGPNLSLTGSLATLLWLIMLRREGLDVTPWQFLRIGALVTIPALALALVCVR